MNKQTEFYKGIEIIIETKRMGEHGMRGHERGILLTMAGGEKIHIMQTKQNLFGSHYLPYTAYPSVLDLAKNIIDTIPFVPTKITLTSC